MKRILFLMSDTGGGHRAACRAITAALEERHAGEFDTEWIDVFKEYSPWPLNTAPSMYGLWVNTHQPSYEMQFITQDEIFKRSRTANRVFARDIMYPSLKHLFRNHKADLIVCVHPVFVRPALYAMHKIRLRVPFVTVISDYALPAVLWYDPRATKTLVPTIGALERGLQLGIPEEKLLLTGPVLHPRFTKQSMSQAEAREHLGWDAHAHTVLLMGGGDGMGRLLPTAKAIDASPINTHLVVIAGKNAKLKQKLEGEHWHKPTRVHGFRQDIDVLMRAADLVVSKAGPATITEAATLGTPIIMNGAIRYQESPNADFVVAQGAGLYAHGPEAVAKAVQRVFSTPGKLTAMRQAIARLAEPNAIYRIADEIWNCLD